MRILGPLRIDTLAGAVDLGGIRQRALLACLVVRRGVPATFEQMTAALWGERPPATARQQIRNVMYQLRRSLVDRAPDVVIDTDSVGYVVRVDAAAVDAGEFEALTGAADAALAEGRRDEAIALLGEGLALWRGPALAEFGDNEYLRRFAEALDEERAIAFERVTQLRLDRGESQALVGELRLMLAQYPLRESLRGLLMTALRRCGRPADALQVYEHGRRLLREELGVDPGPELYAVYFEILQAAGSPGEVTSAAARPGPSNIPGATSDFTGRVTDIDRLLGEVEAIREHAVAILSIDGMGGVGKTSLAIQLAQRLQPRFPDGQFFVDLRGFSSQQAPLSPEQALDQLLRAAGVRPELIPAGEDLRSQLWRTTMARQRIVLICDNAVDAAQVRPLIPGNGALAIVTSRRRMPDLDGSIPCSLDLLPHDDAVALFSRIAGPLRPGDRSGDLHRVVELCGRLPLAIRIAAARFRERGAWTLETLVNRLSDRVAFLAAGDRSVSAALDLSYQSLDPTHQRLFRLLGEHPGQDFDAPAVAALAGLPAGETEAGLDVLYGDNLLLQLAPDRYQLHNLVREYALQLLAGSDPREDRGEAVTRLLDYHLLAARAWCAADLPDAYVFEVAPVYPDVTVPQPLDTAAAVARLRIEWANMVAAVRLAIAHDRHRHTWQIVCALAPYLARQHYTGAIPELLTAAVAAAVADDSAYGLSAVLTLSSIAARNSGDLDWARRHLAEALMISGRERFQALHAYQHLFQGLERLSAQDLPSAWRSLSTAHRIARRRGEPAMYATSGINLALVARDVAAFDIALTLARWAADVDHSFGTIHGNAIIVVGSILHAIGDYPAALRTLEDGHRRCREHGSTGGITTALALLSVTQRCLGNLSAALDLARDAWTASAERTIRDMDSHALVVLGEALLAVGDLDGAQRAFTDSLTSAVGNHLPQLVARGHEGLAHVAAARGDLTGAREEWMRAVDGYPPQVAWPRSNPAAHLADVDAVCERCDTGRAGGSGRRRAEPLAEVRGWLGEVDELMTVDEPEPPVDGQHR